MLNCIEREDVSPVCPHCGHGLKELWATRVQSLFGKRYVYFCPNCRKVLGVSHRKGFWMG